MKKIATLTAAIALCLVIMSSDLQAQYTYDFTYSSDAGNPGGLNIEDDAPGQLAWITIMPGSQSSNMWSPVTMIPFDFDFYGTPVSHFKASQNGLITFDTAAVALPNANTGLPNPALPDKTLCVFWDEFTASPPTGDNDEIRINVFGTAPNRQFWIKWYSFEYGNPTAGFNYFTAVLEESTNNIYFVDQWGSSSPLTSATVGVQFDDATATLADSNRASSANSSVITDNDFFTFSPRFDAPNNTGILALINPPTPLTAGIQSVEAVIGNFGNNVLDSVQVHWAVDGVIQTSTNYYGPLDPYPSIDTINLGTYDFQTGFTHIDLWTSQPNGQMDALPGDDTLSLNLCTGLTGVYSIGGMSPDFNTINDAINALNSCGVTDPVTFFIAPGMYNESIEIPEVQGASAVNRITFDGVDAMTTTLVDSNISQPGLIQMDGADYITITNLTLENRRTTDAWGIHLRNQSNYNVISNCRIIMDPAGEIDVIGIVASDDLFFDFDEGDNANYCRFENNIISGGEMGINLDGIGSSVAAFMKGMIIKNNTLIGMDDYAMYLDNQDSIEIIGNKIGGLRNAGGDGIYCFDLMNFVIEANQIVVPAWGINVADGNFDAPPSRRARLINNMVKSEASYAINLDDIDQVDIFHNTAYGNPGFRINDFTSLDIRNNLFQSDVDYAFESDEAIVGHTINYNNYFTPASNSLFVKDGTVIHADLASWQSAEPTLNLNSSEIEPIFTSESDLHRVSNTVSNTGDNSVGVMMDVDGDMRPLSPDVTVDMGADEYNVLTHDAQAIFIQVSHLACGRSMDSIYMAFRNIGTNVITDMNILVQIRNATNLDLTYAYNGNLNPLEYDTVLVATVNTEAGGQYEITGISQLSGDQNPANDSSDFSFSNFSIFPPTVTYLPSCDTSSLLLAQTHSVVAWYDSVNGVNPIYVGNNFPIQPGNSDTTLYYQLTDISSSLTTTFAGGNGAVGGNMFDVINKVGLPIVGIEIHNNNGVGSSVPYSIYYLPGGSYVGNETNSTAWTFHSAGTAISAGAGNPTLVEFPMNPLFLPQGVTSALYVEYDARYTDGDNVYEDDYFKITAGVGLSGTFGPSIFDPRTFNGSLIYGLEACNTNRDSITITHNLQCRNSTQYLDENGVLDLLPADVTENAFHNCGLDFMIEPKLFGCADLGMHDVTVTFTDSMGMVSTCIAQINVLDSFNNFLQCPSPDTTIYFDGTCNYTIPDLTGQIASCTPLSSLTQSPASGDILHGQTNYAIVFTAVNMADDTAYCYQTLHLLDTVAPQITCAGDVNAPADPGMCTANVTITGPTVMDGCGIATVVNDRNGTNDASGIYPPGQTSIIWTVTDSSGNQSSCTQLVMVTENEAPMITCPGDIDSECPQVIVPSPVVSDNCGIASVINDFNNTDDASDDYPQGTTIVTWIVTDSSGLTDTCMMSVTVTDTVAPVINCPGDLIVYTTDQSCAVAVNYNSGVLATQDLIAVSPYDDSVYILSDTSSYNYMGSLPLTHPTMNIASSNGLAINPIDGNYYIIFKANGISGRLLGQLNPFTGAVDSIGNLGDNFAGLTISPDGRFFGVTGDGATVPESLFEIDPTTAATTLRATLGAGSDGENICFNPDDGKIYHWSGRDTNPAMQKVDTSTWTVSDVTRSGYNYDEVFGSMYKGNNEFILANLDMEVIIVDTSGFAVNTGILTHMYWKGMALRNQGGGGITATDNCGYTIQQTTGFGSDSLFPIGTTLNTFVATDAAGNADTCSFTVTVVDTNGPTAQCQDIVVSLDGNGTGLVEAAQMNNGSCGTDLSFSSNPISFSCAELGLQQAWLIVTDGLGKKDSCLANVMVVDTAGPMAQCIPGGSTTLETDGSVTLMAFQLNGGSSDACSPTSTLRYSFSGTDVNDDMLVFTCADLGLQGIEMWVWDESDNTSSCVTWIQVNDLYAPTPNCNPIMITLGNDGTYSLTSSDSMAIVAGSSNDDGCGGYTVTFSPSTFSCADTMMAVDVTVVFADTSGNADSCIAMVTVNAPPAASVIYVDKDAIGNDDGSSWAHAYTTLSAALNPDNMPGCDAFAEIWVAEGTYVPTDSAGMTASDPANNSFVMLPGVGIYGGFNGTETVREDRNFRTQITTLDGNSTSYHVVQNNGNGLDHSAILDGFYITGGNATGVVFDTKLGGGMYNRASSPLINHCTFSANNALYGGGMLNRSSQARVMNTYFIDNTATFGAGMHNWQSSTTEVVNCIFSQNAAIKDAGAIYNNNNCDVEIINTSISGNVCSRWGGAMMTAKNSTANVTNSILWENAPNELRSDAFIGHQLAYTDISGGYPGAGNLNIDPMFMDAGSNDLSLPSHSPAVNMGSDGAVPVDVTTDISGNIRIFGNVDMGACEAIFPVRLAKESVPWNAHIYPNPTSGLIQLTSNWDVGVIRWKIQDQRGVTVLQGEDNKATFHVDLQNLSAQPYIITLTSSEGVLIKRIIRIRA